MSGHLIIFVGLQASGKTTEAMRLVAEADPPGSVVRVNKDDIRTALRSVGWEYSPANEAAHVVPLRNHLIHEALVAGKTVISDDTNLAPGHVAALERLASTRAVTCTVRRFDVTLAEAIARDAAREASVGAAVIRKTAEQYLPHLLVTP